MTSSIVCDASLVIAATLPEKYTNQARALLQRWEREQTQLAAPLLFHYEIISVTRRNVFQGRLSLAEGLDIRDRLLGIPIQTYFDDALLRRAYELATQFNRPTAYDSQYLAVAERLNCEFWTADQRLFNAAHEQLPWVKWVGNFNVSES
jgi:predicted nucleic acid-binding protein